jgi:GNAT superfamily N-acetyltransferase
MNGAAIRDGTLFRLLLESDAEAAFAVHLAATRLLRNDLVRRESLDFIRDQINDGFVIGGFSEVGNLIAYAALNISNTAINNIADFLELDPASRKKFCLLDGVAVHPEWQSGGIHHALIAERLCYARDLGRDLVGVTVSHLNLKSLKNLLGNGFLVMHATHLYGGHRRLILIRNLEYNAESVYPLVRTVALGCFVKNAEALKSGLCGFNLSLDKEGNAIMHYGSRPKK